MEIKEQIEVTISEVADAYQTHESLYDFLTERVEEKIGRAFNCFQMSDYEIVGHNGAMITLEISGYEEDD